MLKDLLGDQPRFLDLVSSNNFDVELFEGRFDEVLKKKVRVLSDF